MSTINILGRDEFWGNEGEVAQIVRQLNRYQTTSIAASRQELQEISDLIAEKFGIRPAVQEYVALDADGDWWWFDRATDQWLCVPYGEEEVVSSVDEGFYPGINYIKAEWGIITSPHYPEGDE